MACPRCTKVHHVDSEGVRKCLRANPRPEDHVVVQIPITVGKKRRLKHPTPEVKVWKGDAK